VRHQAAPTSTNRSESTHQLGVEHDQGDERTDGAENEVAGRFVDEKVVLIITQLRSLGER